MKNIWSRFWARSWWVKGTAIGFVGLVLLVALTPTPEDDDTAAADDVAAATGTTETVASTAEATETAAATPAQTEVATPTEAPEPEGYDDGTWLVGEDIAPGRYRTTDASRTCYWARLSGLTGSLDDVLANDIGSGPSQVIDILDSDRAFDSNGCGTWVPIDGAATDSPDAAFGDGVWVVGMDISAGTWRAQPEGGCYWSRMTGFDGELGSVIANDLPSGPAIVEILASDVGFKTTGCGEWTKVE